MKSSQTKPSIVFAHGIWADGSCFQKLIPTLRAEGHDAFRFQPGTAIPHFDVLEDIRLPEFVLLFLGRFVRVRAQRRDVDEACDTRVHTSVRDYRSAV